MTRVPDMARMKILLARQICNPDIISNTLKYFPNTKEFLVGIETHEKPKLARLTHYFSDVIQSVINVCSSRFTEFREFAETATLILYPYTLPADNLNLEVFAINRFPVQFYMETKLYRL